MPASTLLFLDMYQVFLCTSTLFAKPAKISFLITASGWTEIWDCQVSLSQRGYIVPSISVRDASRITAISVTSGSSSANEREDKTVIGWSSSLARRNIEECYERPHYGKD
ncbi:hypothetical protein DTO164E3_7888 [Paecilomyces variotii]|nr:hypothetical protein DTO164E3_7888 [Paecilomyces variotii]KAJ9194630.1 hypothetical protein DTO032I3_7245 [Paecilomyces variotii]KAJ9230005.1 hypothetical protein DTO169E5_8644 [Paecilomyces variotii]KAJ9249368.1 hypothetical protein DTO207G8_6754 [Paecilomyces variotii]KAJ9275490.1 hypothetical protein DTO021D3_7673 [Paecilomyces variotii]